MIKLDGRLLLDGSSALKLIDQFNELALHFYGRKVDFDDLQLGYAKGLVAAGSAGGGRADIRKAFGGQEPVA
jgi:hypothetical protein